MHESTESLSLVYLNAPDVAALELSDDEILDAVAAGLRAQGEGRTVIEPRMHLAPGRTADGSSIHGYFNVLRGYIAPLALRFSPLGNEAEPLPHAFAFPARGRFAHVFTPDELLPLDDSGARIVAADFADRRATSDRTQRLRRAPPLRPRARPATGSRDPRRTKAV